MLPKTVEILNNVLDATKKGLSGVLCLAVNPAEEIHASRFGLEMVLILFPMKNLFLHPLTVSPQNSSGGANGR